MWKTDNKEIYYLQKKGNKFTLFSFNVIVLEKIYKGENQLKRFTNLKQMKSDDRSLN